METEEGHAEEMVQVVNTINRRTQQIPRSECDLFLRKHKLFRLVVADIPEEEKKRKSKKVSKKPTKPVKEEKVPYQRKRKSPEDSLKSSPAPSETDTKRRKSVKESNMEVVLNRPNPLIVIPLKDMHEIVRLFTSSPAGCVDWEMISHTATGGRIPAADVEYAANEFLPHVHYRPSIGLVVMERQSKIPSDYQKHRMTMKRMRQGLGSLIGEIKARLMGKAEAEEAVITEEPSSGVVTPEQPVDSPELEGEEQQAPVPERARRRSNYVPVNVNTYLSSLPSHVVEELKQRAQVAISRFEKAHVPTYAMRSAPIAKVDADGGSLTATGRIRKRYETKAMRLAREAASGQQPTPSPVPVAPVQLSLVKQETYEPPPFFLSMARQFVNKASSEDGV